MSTTMTDKELEDLINGLTLTGTETAPAVAAPQAAAPAMPTAPVAPAAPPAPAAPVAPPAPPIAQAAPVAPPAPPAAPAPIAPTEQASTVSAIEPAAPTTAAAPAAVLAEVTAPPPAPAAPTYAAPTFAAAAQQKREAEATAGANAATKAMELEQFIDPELVRQDVAVNPHDLDSAIVQHAAKFAYYSEMTVRARRQYERVKALVDVLETQLDAYYRKKLADEGQKVTEKMVESAVKMDSRWLAAQHRVADAKAIHGSCETVTEALRQRKDMLVQISVDRRIEKEGELRVNALKGENAARGAVVVNAIAQHAQQAMHA